jgi:glycosyltransferase A (GT-A) superfamily protein (DUF2064 family)
MRPEQVAMAVIAKAPVPGRVKTRLCPPCSPLQASAIAEAALRDTLDAVAATTAGRHVVVLDGARPAWIPDAFEVLAQRGGGLDERLAAAFDDLGGPAVVIGMDTPQVTTQLLDGVVASLCGQGTDAVLGRANDGGYWVIGLRRPDPAVLLGVPMSVAHTHRAQSMRLVERGLRTAAVQELTDMDTFDEALQVASIATGARFAAAVELVRAATASTAPDDPFVGRDVTSRR